MKLFKVGETELRTARISDGLVIILKKGQISLSIPLVGKEVESFIKAVTDEKYEIDAARIIVRARTEERQEWKDKYGDKEDI